MPSSATLVSATANTRNPGAQAITVPGYTIVACIDETQLSDVYRGRRDETNEAVVIKALKTESPPSSEIARFRHEYELIGRFDIEGVVKLLDIVYVQDRWALVMEDFGGVSLQQFLGAPLPLERFLDLAIRLAKILDSLHRHNISHCDIKPRNVIYNSQTDTLKLTDFGIAAELSRSSEQIYNPRVIEATLAYMSPEQTGRMNCVVDYRTDFYSLGVTFYEMITGKLPFNSREPMKIIHSHIARRPVPPHHLNRNVPEVLSRIVMKLLEKGAGDRYQSSRGLIADLERCRRQLEATGQIDAFEIGRQDISLKFTMPQVLVGRENEIARLSEAFDRASEGAMSFVLVSGAPGIGKSALVNEIDKTVAARHGFFVSGKYDHLWRHVPYSAFIQAFQGLGRRLLATSDQEIREWKEKLLSVLQPNAKLITDNIPAFRLIVGDQPDVPELAPEEARNRFKRILKNFVQVFADQRHPLLLFLDDLQWADPASIELIRDLSMDRGLSYFFLVGTYRDNEVAAHHPLMLAVDAACQAGTQVETLHLDALDESGVNRLLATFLRCDPQDCRPLAAVIHEKTLGNPFFVTQFLKTLYERKHLSPKPSGGWQWDLTSVREMQLTDNVVDFMAEKIRRLPEEALELIKICACAGNRFDAETLAELTKKPIHEVFDLLKYLGDEGLLIQKQRFFTFHHDRIHEAAYSRISEEKRIHTHYRIGNLALQQTPEEALPDKVFYIADQLNQARELITDPQERTRLAGLNLKAGIKAKESTAYDAAADYFGTGVALLPPEPWQTDYRLTYELHKELMECRFLSRNFDEAKQLFQIIIANAANRVDKARVYTIMIVLYTNINSPEEAIKLGLEALRLFGIKYAIKTSPVPVLAELAKLKIRLRKMSLDNILDLPMMTEGERVTCHNVMLAMATPAFYANPNLFALLALRSLNECIKYGLNATSSTMLNVVAAIFGNLLGDYEQSYRMGELALQLNEKLDNRKEAGQIHHTFAFFIQHWKKHARYDIDIYQKEYQLCLDVGDFIFAGHSVGATLDCRLMIGHRLDDILADAEKYRELMRHVKDPFIEARYRENIQMARCLKGLTKDRLSLDGEEFDEAAHLEALYKEKNLFGICFALLYKMKLYYLYGHHEEADKLGAELDGHIHAPIGTLLVPEHYFYYCLNLAALLKSADSRKKRKSTRIIEKYQRKMDKWARHCPENFRHKHNLVQAELLAARGCVREAIALYHAAVNGAHQNGFINEEAIARERAALFYFDLNAEEEAMGFLQKAHQCYGRWGAIAKQTDLEQRWPILASVMEKGPPLDAREVHTTGDTSSYQLDLSTVLQTSQAISSEIVLDNLLQKIMQLSITNAGAQRGFLLLETDGRLTVEAGGDSEEGQALISKSLPLAQCETLCQAVVNYVWRSHEPVILSNASEEGPFSNDPYIKGKRCKSILCMPILNKNQLTGILYMENNLAPNAFTEERLEILGVIVSQAAISLDNARLFDQATTDGLTRLFVHRYFQFLLDQEIERSRRYSRPCSLIMMDIDNFKHFNDTYGHQLGDEVLAKVAGELKKNTRATDIAARYGGEEFVAVLPETAIDQALLVAEKIRSLVENLEIAHNGEPLRVTISLGAAVFPDHAMEKDELIRMADNALYAAKGAGKNCVRTV